jgi:hypothetical protein
MMLRKALIEQCRPRLLARVIERQCGYAKCLLEVPVTNGTPALTLASGRKLNKMARCGVLLRWAAIECSFHGSRPLFVCHVDVDSSRAARMSFAITSVQLKGRAHWDDGVRRIFAR